MLVLSLHGYVGLEPELGRPDTGGQVTFVIELAKSMLKILFLSILLYLVIRAALPDLAKIPDCGVRCIPSVLGVMLEQIVFNAAFVFVVVAAADYVFQRFQHTKKLRMTKN